MRTLHTVVILYLLLFLDEIGSEAEIQPDLSLITGNMRTAGIKDDLNSGENSCNALSTYAAGEHSVNIFRWIYEFILKA